MISRHMEIYALCISRQHSDKQIQIQHTFFSFLWGLIVCLLFRLYAVIAYVSQIRHKTPQFSHHPTVAAGTNSVRRAWDC